MTPMELVESYRNGNKTEVLEILELSPAYFIAQVLHHECDWNTRAAITAALVRRHNTGKDLDI